MIIMWSLEFLALSTCEMFQFIKREKKIKTQNKTKPPIHIHVHLQAVEN